MLLIWLSLAGAADMPEPTGDSPPWGRSSTRYLSPTELEGLEAYERYQRIAKAGLPIYLGGLSVVAYSVFALETNRMTPASAVVSSGLGLAVAWGGSGALGWGSYSAATRLAENSSRRPHNLAGKLSIGLLGVSGAGYLIAVSAVTVPPLSGGGLVLGLGAGIAAGIPGIVQVAINPIQARKVAEERWTVVPYVEGRRRGLAVAHRF